MVNLEEFKEYLNNILSDKINKIVVSNSTKQNVEFKRVEITNKINRYMVVKYTQKQAFTSNIELENLKQYLIDLLVDFKQFNFFASEFEYSIKISKKGKVFYNKSKNQAKSIAVNNNNNRQKEYLIKEGSSVLPLVDMGIFTHDGKIVKSMYDKYKQINRFLEIIDDYIKDSNLTELNIIDFGCGKSYLTFIVYYYLTYVRKIKANIIGLDLKKDVIEKCNESAKKYGYNNLSFKLGDINGYNPEFKVDMVISLHACDTATDYALYNAIKWGVKMIFSVPCCQHEVNKTIKTDSLNILTKYGIIKERLSSDITDVVRCNLLKAMSYSVDLIEFVNFDHTPKNLLIRARLTNISKETKYKQLEEINQLRTAFSFDQSLYNLLNNDRLLD